MAQNIYLEKVASILNFLFISFSLAFLSIGMHYGWQYKDTNQVLGKALALQ